MPISVSGTTITFNDSTTQTTAATGTVSSVATGNGLQGGTITTSGTLTIACPGFNTVGSYALARPSGLNNQGSNYALTTVWCFNNSSPGALIRSGLSGTWKWMAASTDNDDYYGLACRVS